MSGAQRFFTDGICLVIQAGICENTVPSSRHVRRSVETLIWMLPWLTSPFGSPVENRFQVFPSLIMDGAWITTSDGIGFADGIDVEAIRDSRATARPGAKVISKLRRDLRNTLDSF